MSHRPAGKPVATIESGKGADPVPTFFDCVIVEDNAEVLERPALLNADPYGSWIARVRPASPDDALAGLVTGEEAFAGYCEGCRGEDIHCERKEA